MSGQGFAKESFVAVTPTLWGKEYLYDAEEVCKASVNRTRQMPQSKLKRAAWRGRELDPTDVLIAPSGAV